MHHLLKSAVQALQTRSVWLALRIRGAVHARTWRDHDRDRGANVVETIIIVAGFAILAAAIYTTVAGKVHTWIAKIP